MSSHAVAEPIANSRLGSLLGAVWELTKPQLALFSVLSALTGYLVAGGTWSGMTTTFTLAFLGISMAAGGALSLNQCLEWSLDARMRRTRDRPLPSARISLNLAMGISASLSLGGAFLLSLTVSPVTGALAAATIFIYGYVYTPLKRRTPWASEIGAVSGALPPLIGAAAAGNVTSPEVWVFAFIILFWQMPHFFAIGWIHRSDYAAAGFRLRPAIDPQGRSTSFWILVYTIALITASVLPSLFGWMSFSFALVSGFTSLVLLAPAAAFRKYPGARDRIARRLFSLTLLHLPMVMLTLVLERLFV